jgi:uncharacterized protein (DUF58 family)
MKIAQLKNGERAPGDTRILTSAVTLIALGISIIVLDTWGNLFVRVFVGLFWASFMLVLNGPRLIRATRTLKRTNAGQRRTNRDLATYEHRSSGY